MRPVIGSSQEDAPMPIQDSCAGRRRRSRSRRARPARRKPPSAPSRQARSAIGTVIFGQDRWSRRSWCRSCRAATGCWSACPAWPRRSSSTRSARCWGSTPAASSSRPTSCPPTSSAPRCWTRRPGGRRAFRFVRGPIFAQLLMADEINRASPRTQSALLQAMQERHVTVAGERHDLPRPVPRPGDPEPDRAGGHVSAARGPARPLPHADRRHSTRTARPRSVC